MRMWVCGKKFHCTDLLQKALGKQVYDIVSFIHIILGGVGSLGEDLNIGGELYWRLSKLFGVKSGNSGNISLSGIGLSVAVTCWTEISALRVVSSP